MSALQRLLLVCLLSLAIPLQGYAAAAMAFCGPAHARMTAASVDAHHEHIGGVSLHAGHDGQAPSHHASMPAGDDLAHWQQLGDQDCSACAACCAAALPATAPHLPPSTATGEPAPPPRLTSASFLTGGQERPPR